MKEQYNIQQKLDKEKLKKQKEALAKHAYMVGKNKEQ